MELTTPVSYETLRVTDAAGGLRVTLHRPEQRNSINPTMLRELQAVLDRAEADPDCRVVVLEGTDGAFSTGMDLAGAVEAEFGGGDPDRKAGEDFLGLLKRFTTVPLVVIAKVDGTVAGGGVGLVAASDFVVATERSTFSLPEALWGLLPCCVAPFLIRRVGFQKAYAMTLSTQPVPARRAEAMHLVDEVADDLDALVRRLTFRLTKIDGTTVGDLKRYYRRLWLLTEDMERLAVDEFTRLMASPTVQRRITDFTTGRRLPWEG